MKIQILVNSKVFLPSRGLQWSWFKAKLKQVMYFKGGMNMTHNQISYHTLMETIRHNKLSEKEFERSNLAKEHENYRSNVNREYENTRSNTARENENFRSNVAREQENRRHNEQDELYNFRSLNVRQEEASIKRDEARTKQQTADVGTAKIFNDMGLFGSSVFGDVTAGAYAAAAASNNPKSAASQIASSIYKWSNAASSSAKSSVSSKRSNTVTKHNDRPLNWYR